MKKNFYALTIGSCLCLLIAFSMITGCDGPSFGCDEIQAIDVKMIGEIIPGRIHFCSSVPCSAVPARARLCPDDDLNCRPRRESTITWNVNGRPFSGIFLWAGSRPDGTSLIYDSGPATVEPSIINVYDSTSAIVSADMPGLKLSYYLDITPGEDYALNFDGSGYESSLGETHLFNHESYNLGFDHKTLHHDVDALVQKLIDITQAPKVRYQAFFMPTELAGTLGVEGNISYGGGTVGVNFGNPPWLASQSGGAHQVILREMCHEYTHELFGRTLRPQFNGIVSCLNEGLADALGNHLGYIDNANFGYEDNKGVSLFENGCSDIIDRPHYRGNCVLWHVKQAGYFSDDYFTNLFTADVEELFQTGGSPLPFNSCQFDDEAIGNIYVVLFSQAAGEDLSHVITAAGLPNAGSLEASRAALSLY